MAKEMVKEKETSTALALMGDMEADAGLGFENVTTKDVAIPYLSLAQATSPRVKRGDQQVPGLSEGDFLNTATMEIFKSGAFRVVPCGFQKRYIERTDLGAEGRMVAVHDDEAVLNGCTKDEKGKYQNAEGNYIIPTAMHFVMILKADGSYVPGVISLASSQIKRSKNWLALMQGLKIKTAKGMLPAPMCSHSYLVSSTPVKNAEGSWMAWDFTAPEMLADADLYATAKAFCAEVNKGTVKVAEAPATDDAPAATSEHF